MITYIFRKELQDVSANTLDGILTVKLGSAKNSYLPYVALVNDDEIMLPYDFVSFVIIYTLKYI